MAGMDEKDDALDLVRWCWPQQSWERPILGPVRSLGGKYFAEDVLGDPDYDLDISDAEQVVLARGLAEQYGRALTAQIVSGGDIDYGGHQAAFFCELPDGVRAAMLATAPLASRLRALARVARDYPHCGYDQHKDAP